MRVGAYDWTSWTPWCQLEGLDFKQVPRGLGAYVISVGTALNRVVGIDSEGMIDIGESGGLRQRLKDFCRCATRRGEEGHMAGWRFAFFQFHRHFTFESLRVRWIATASKDDARDAEGRLMLAYLLNHAELPPLNYSFNWRPFERDGWDLFDRLLSATSVQSGSKQ